MAQDEIILKLRVDDGELKLSTATIENQSKTIDKNTKKKKQGTKASNRFNKAEKALYQSNLSASKGFSKMNQTMGGSSGLVAAYATLAANVFAATAAFGALSRAAQFENLRKGLQELGAQSGRTLSIVADRLREVTGSAISAEEAMRAAAVGISGGFSGKELEGLAKIAKGASITLGRDLSDAFDRLTRGAIKLEPEILDELGIMVRVDEAAENYAATIGKTAQSLTQMEKRQAFMNEILEQGESKFGAIADSLDADPYAKLAATFGDLTKNIFNFANRFLGLGAIAEYLSGNIYVLFGVMTLFGSSIAGKMLPVLSEAGKRALDSADGMLKLKEEMLEFNDAQQKFRQAQIGATGAGSDAFQKLAKKAREGKVSTKELNVLQGKLKLSMNALTREGIKQSTLESAAHKQKINNIRIEQRNLAALITQKKIQQKIAIETSILEAKAVVAQQSGIAIQAFGVGAATFGEASSVISGGYEVLSESLDGISRKALGLADDVPLDAMTKGMNRLKAAAATATAQMRLFGSAVLKALPYLAAMVIVGGVIYGIFRKVYNTKEHKEYVKTTENLDKIFDELPKKAEAYQKAMNNVRNGADQQVKSWEVVSGTITEITDAIEEMNKAREKDKRNFSDSYMQKEIGRFTGGGDYATVAERAVTDGEANFHQFSDGLKNIAGVIEQEAISIPTMVALMVTKSTQEVDKLNQLLALDIPEITDSIGRGLNEALKTVTEDTTIEGFLEKIRQILIQTKNELGGLGPTAVSLRTAFKEAEKAGTNFLNKFGKTTSVDKLQESLTTVSGTFKDFKQAVGDAATLDSIEEIGKKFLDVGPAIARLIGPEFVSLQSNLKAASVELDRIKDQSGEGSTEFANQLEIVKNLTLELGKQDPQLQALFKRVTAIQIAERERKVLEEQITKSIQIQQKLYKKAAALAGADVKMTVTKQKLTLAELKATSDMLKLEDKRFELFATNGQSAFFTFAEMIDLAKDEAYDLEGALAKNKVTLEDFNQQKFAMFKRDMAQLDLDHTIATQLDNILIQRQEALKEELSIREDIAESQEKQLINEQKIQNFLFKGQARLDPVESAEAKVRAAIQEFTFAAQKAEIEKEIIAARGRIAKAEIELLNKQIELVNAQTDSNIQTIDEELFGKQIDANTRVAQQAINENIDVLRGAVLVAVGESIEDIQAAITSGDITGTKGKTGIQNIIGQLSDIVGPQIVGEETMPEGQAGPPKPTTIPGVGETGTAVINRAEWESNKAVFEGIAESMSKISPEGEAYAGAITGMLDIADGFSMIADSAAGSADRIEAIQHTMQGISSVMDNISKARVAAIDNEIAAEEARDGKSAKSLAKIKALKKQKYEMEKKAFQQKKKMSIAQALINTYEGVTSALKDKDWPMAAAVLAMGLAQVAMISKTQFTGAAPEASSVSPPSEINIGKRNNRVDVSRAASAGELAWLRGERGIGTTATNFTPRGGAAGLRKGYASGGEILVGERGPEVIRPTAEGYTVVPNDALGGKSIVNASFEIHAIDAAGVEEVLVEQQGNIINMIRSAANDHGQEFLEEVDTTVYGGTPRSPGGIDY